MQEVRDENGEAEEAGVIGPMPRTIASSSICV